MLSIPSILIQYHNLIYDLCSGISIPRVLASRMKRPDEPTGQTSLLREPTRASLLQNSVTTQSI